MDNVAVVKLSFSRLCQTSTSSQRLAAGPNPVVSQKSHYEITNKEIIFAKQQQSDFTPGRSTLYRIITLRLLAERRHEYRQPLHATYIEIRAAFDSLDPNSLCNILSIPPKLVDIIKTLYLSTHSAVRVSGTPIWVVISQMTTERILNSTTRAPTVNCDDSGHLIIDLDYADDVFIFASLFDTLKDAYSMNNCKNWDSVLRRKHFKQLRK